MTVILESWRTNHLVSLAAVAARNASVVSKEGNFRSVVKGAGVVGTSPRELRLGASMARTIRQR